MSGAPLVIVGDVLLDREVLGTVDRLCPEAPVPVLAERSTADRPGGAGLAALFAAAADDMPQPWGEVVLVGALGMDEAAERLRELLVAAGVEVVALPLLGATPEKIRMRSGDHLLLRLDRGDELTGVGGITDEVLDVLRSAGALLVSDYGRGVAGQPEVRRALAARAPGVPLVWDPHPLGGDPVPGADLISPNRTEAIGFLEAHRHSTEGGWAATPPVRATDRSVAASMGAAVRLRHHWAADAVAVTLGEHGAVLSDGTHAPRLVPTPLAAHGDPCGAGDRFACAAVSALAAGADPLEAVTAAVAAAAAYVAAGGALALLPETATIDLAGRLLGTRPEDGYPTNARTVKG